jgi:hypothetical protein
MPKISPQRAVSTEHMDCHYKAGGLRNAVPPINLAMMPVLNWPPHHQTPPQGQPNKVKNMAQSPF